LIYEDLNVPDRSRAGEIFHVDFYDHTNPPGMQHGIDGHNAIVNYFRAAFPDVQWTIHDMIAEGDKVVLSLEWTGTHDGEFFGVPATGRRVSVKGTHVIRIADGKVIEHWGNDDDLGLMRQLGVFSPANA
jgi:steroid delta-isomerase-like uncharacterized protein